MEGQKGGGRGKEWGECIGGREDEQDGVREYQDILGRRVSAG